MVTAAALIIAFLVTIKFILSKRGPFRRYLTSLDYSLFSFTSFYRSKCPLTKHNMKRRLPLKRRVSPEPSDQFAIIKFNSIYLDSSDVNFKLRGFLSSIGFIFVGIGLFFYYLFVPAIYDEFQSLIASSYILSWSNPVAKVQAGILVLLIVTECFLVLGFGIISTEFFRFTHYPIRYNRRNRIVYVFRLDGSVLTVPWDKLFFRLRKYEGLGTKNRPEVPGVLGARWDVVGYVLNDEGNYIEEVFPVTSRSLLSDSVKDYWEFIRRFMEEGPEALPPVKRCLPLDNQREPLAFSLYNVLNFYSRAGFVLLFPLDILQTLCRWPAGRTSRLPKWPEWVEAECRVANDDPYFRDASQDPPITFKTHQQEFGEHHISNLN